MCVCVCGYSGYVGAVKGGCCEFGGPVFEFAEFICRCFSENIFFCESKDDYDNDDRWKFAVLK